MYGCQWNWFSCIYWWCDCWQKQQDEFWSVSGILSAHIQTNASELIGRRFTVRWTMTQSILQKQPKSSWGKEADCYAMAKSITWPESDWACISLAEDKTEGKMPQEQAGTEDGCSRGLAEHHQGWNPASADVYAFQTSDCNWLQRICNQVLKSESLIYDYILSHYFWSLNKWEAHMQTVVTPLMGLFCFFSLMMACFTDSDSSLDLILTVDSNRFWMQIAHLKWTLDLLSAHCNWDSEGITHTWPWNSWEANCPITFGPLTSGRHICKLL